MIVQVINAVIVYVMHVINVVILAIGISAMTIGKIILSVQAEGLISGSCQPLEASVLVAIYSCSTFTVERESCTCIINQIFVVFYLSSRQLGLGNSDRQILRRSHERDMLKSTVHRKHEFFFGIVYCKS